MSIFKPPSKRATAAVTKGAPQRMRAFAASAARRGIEAASYYMNERREREAEEREGNLDRRESLRAAQTRWG